MLSAEDALCHVIRVISLDIITDMKMRDNATSSLNSLHYLCYLRHFCRTCCLCSASICSHLHRPVVGTHLHRPVVRTHLHRPVVRTHLHRPVVRTHLHRPVVRTHLHRLSPPPLETRSGRRWTRLSHCGGGPDLGPSEESIRARHRGDRTEREGGVEDAQHRCNCRQESAHRDRHIQGAHGSG